MTSNTYDHKKDSNPLFYYAKFLVDQICKKEAKDLNVYNDAKSHQAYEACFLSNMSPRFRACLNSKKSIDTCNTELKQEREQIYSNLVSPDFGKYEQMVMSTKDSDFVHHSQEELEWVVANETKNRCSEEASAVMDCVRQHGRENAPLQCAKQLTHSEYCFASASCYNPIRECMKRMAATNSVGSDNFVACIESDAQVRSCVANSIQKVKQLTATQRATQEHYIKLAYREALKPTNTSKEYMTELQQTTCAEESAKARACVMNHGEKKCSNMLNDLGMCLYVSACAKQVSKCLDSQDTPNLFACFEHHEATKKCIAKL